LFSSTVVTSQPPSNTANIFALSETFIFSAPTASATSQLPAWTACTARFSAEDPDAQAFSTLYTGMPPNPARRRAIGPGMLVCPCNGPLVAPA
jgi:hypothetical protein